MKRLMAAVAILLLLVGTNVYTRSLLGRTGTAMLVQVGQLEELAWQGGAAELEQACGELEQHWLQTERVWSRFFRSDRLESITIEVARLPALAHHGQTADVSAGLCEIRILLQEVLSFEAPTFADLFAF